MQGQFTGTGMMATLSTEGTYELVNRVSQRRGLDLQIISPMELEVASPREVPNDHVSSHVPLSEFMMEGADWKSEQLEMAPPVTTNNQDHTSQAPNHSLGDMLTHAAVYRPAAEIVSAHIKENNPELFGYEQGWQAQPTHRGYRSEGIQGILRSLVGAHDHELNPLRYRSTQDERVQDIATRVVSDEGFLQAEALRVRDAVRPGYDAEAAANRRYETVVLPALAQEMANTALSVGAHFLVKVDPHFTSDVRDVRESVGSRIDVVNYCQQQVKGILEKGAARNAYVSGVVQLAESRLVLAAKTEPKLNYMQAN